MQFVKDVAHTSIHLEKLQSTVQMKFLVEKYLQTHSQLNSIELYFVLQMNIPDFGGFAYATNLWIEAIAGGSQWFSRAMPYNSHRRYGIVNEQELYILICWRCGAILAGHCIVQHKVQLVHLNLVCLSIGCHFCDHV